MTLNLASFPRRLTVSALLAASLLYLLVQGWTALSQVEESLVTDWWEAPADPGANEAGTAGAPAP
jgi:hypothetical protein